MTLISCHHCGHNHLVGNRSIRSITNADGHVLAEIYCALSDAVVVHDFTTQTTIAPVGRQQPVPA